MITIHEFRFDHDLNTSSLDRLEEDLERRLGYSLKWDKDVPPTEPRKGFYLTYERGGISFNDHGVDGVTLNYYDGQSSKAYLRIRKKHFNVSGFAEDCSWPVGFKDAFSKLLVNKNEFEVKITFPLDEDQQREMGLAISELFESALKSKKKKP